MKPVFLLIASIALASCAAKAPEAAAATPESAARSKKVAKKEPKPKSYPLKTCLVTGDGLDDMDERVTTVYEGQTFEFCCKPCLKKFNKNPGKYVKALAKASG
ncbi:YHS domain-containing protein [Luteolibacter sp. GHJ8]|uniref:YHS domain-containing protein n=1 Tax=Luteolibacter rhizosphaerae TaxID=2989719 RepID=A0ABT3G0P3_9BACT|nr:YHS domain-containing protein [Luteolibacter rhizosphaerae]MCW1913232.1 YHS domain-containing protein [Luteolibacter rhizosphaerae]